MANTKPKLVGIVSNFFEHVGVAAIKLVGPLKIGDKIRLVGGDIDVEELVKSMQIQHESVKSAKKGDEIGTKIGSKVRKGYKVYKA